MEKTFKAILYALFFVFAFKGVQIIIAYLGLLVIYKANFVDYQGAYSYYSNIISSVADLLCAFMLIMLVRKLGKDVKVEIGLNPIDWKSALASVIGGIALIIFVKNVLDLIPISDRVWQEYGNASMTISTGPEWAQILFAVVAAPICEEIVFRGLVYNNCRNVMPKALAIVFAALCFGAVHEQVLWISYATVCGFFLIMAFNNTGSLLGSLLMHMGFNGFSQFAPKGWELTGTVWLIISAVILVLSYVIMRPVKKIDNTQEVGL